MSEVEFLGEILDGERHFFPWQQAADGSPQVDREAIIRKLLPTVYSGPTIGDIENALAFTCRGAVESGGLAIPRPAIAFPDKGFNKMENKYTLKIKCCANGVADDGYKWRKYGQKSIKNSPNPRSYYRCTNPRCNAKKQVERSVEDPETLIVTYEGLHLHYAYSHFLLSRPLSSSAAAAVPAAKRAKADLPAGQTVATAQTQEAQAAEENPQQEPVENLVQTPPQGLLEDIVPLLVRNPYNSGAAATSGDPSLSSVPSSPPSSASSSFTWPHSPSYLDLGVLSGIV
ncbi:unnamed protein product [Spirodela intermedia]|uniref:WRKY domain-containing protein n=1 Tax=Spirodela intermedia TaxID=51605 RepID=A0A7I8K049_SPIIN|nr:unnamed protein product [Spirodela intermedia]